MLRPSHLENARQMSIAYRGSLRLQNFQIRTRGQGCAATSRVASLNCVGKDLFELGQIVAFGAHVGEMNRRNRPRFIATLKAGVSPLPKPLGLAFVETVFGRTLPLPVGLLFHTLWVTTFSVLYVVLFRDALTFMRALGLGVALWLFVLVFFFPVAGWGLFGLVVGPKVIIGAAMPHLLFSFSL